MSPAAPSAHSAHAAPSQIGISGRLTYFEPKLDTTYLLCERPAKTYQTRVKQDAIELATMMPATFQCTDKVANRAAAVKAMPASHQTSADPVLT